VDLKLFVLNFTTLSIAQKEFGGSLLRELSCTKNYHSKSYIFFKDLLTRIT
jgi:hypothetical protein